MDLDLMSGISDEKIRKLSEEVNRDLVKKNKYDKFGDGTYLSVDVFRRMMNDIFDHAWSWEILEEKIFGDILAKGTGFVLVKGRLTVPGIGIKEGYGIGKFDKADNSTAFSAASSFAFKSCCRQVGIGASILDDDFEDPLYEAEVGGAGAPKQQSASKPAADDRNDEKPAAKNKDSAPAADDPWTTAIRKKVDQLKKTYKINTTEQMIAFAQIWNPKIKGKADLTPDLFVALFDYVEENSEEFEVFDASEVA